jgi:hypothetical protein
MSEEAEDWRLALLESPYIYDLIFFWTTYKSPGPQWDHAHCDGCNTKFVEPGFSPCDCDRILHEDYQATEGPTWLCAECFREFRDHFRWRLKAV